MAWYMHFNKKWRDYTTCSFKCPHLLKLFLTLIFMVWYRHFSNKWRGYTTCSFKCPNLPKLFLIVFLPSEKKISSQDVSMAVSPCLAGAEDSKYLYLLLSFAFFGPVYLVRVLPSKYHIHSEFIKLIIDL